SRPASPATAGGALGFGAVPLPCARDLAVQGGPPLCVGLRMYFTPDRAPREFLHVYLRVPGVCVMTSRAEVVGTGLIGGSIGLALRARGWHVTGRDVDEARAARAHDLGALDAVGHDPDAELTFVAVPVSAIAAEATRAVAGGSVVTDVGGVKAPVVASVDHPRFVGGHPMAGSEQEGVDGA